MAALIGSDAAVAGDELAAAALAYAARGWPVFPVKPDKTPRTLHGFKDADQDPDRIAEWWRMWPTAGIAIATGAASGLLVLDVDGEEGAETLHELERRHGDLPATVEALTGGGGRHIYFKHPGGTVANTARRLGPGLDTRGDGGYVVAPPSIHSSGRRYEWSVDGDPELAALAPPPRWLLEETRRNGKPRPVSAWRELASAGAAEGARNHSAAALAGHLLGRGIDPYVTLELVVAWDQGRNRPPLGRTEVEAVVDSIARREAAKWAA